MDKSNLDVLNNLYKECKSDIKNHNSELKDLMENSIVKEYIDLKKQIKDLKNKKKELERAIKLNVYSSCNHILICSQFKKDYHIGQKYKDHVCIKCGLSDYVVNKKRKKLSFDEKVMLEYLSKHGLRGSYVDIVCDPDIACKVYSKVKAKHPEINDKEIVAVFKDALEEVNAKELIKK